MEDPASPPRRAPSDDSAKAAAGWSSRLAVAVSAAILVQGASGWWLELAPFTRASEAQLILHTLLGIAMVVPAVLYLCRHLAAWGRQRPTAEWLLGLLAGAVLTVLLVSGLVVSWQAFEGARVAESWHFVHLVLGLALPLLVVAHLVLAWRRRRAQATRVTTLERGRRRFGKGLAAAGLGTVVVVGLLVGALPRPLASTSVPASYTLPEYAQQFEEYRGNPFAPTYARTADLRLLPAEMLSGSESCGSAGCHSQILAEWSPSAHRFAVMNPPFQAVQRAFAADREPAETRYCAGCHDPISLFAGAKDLQNQSLAAPGMAEGLSCAACHSVSAVDRRGNADYVLSAPRAYLWEGRTGWRKAVSDFLIRAAPRQHLADYDRAVLRTPEYCGACHKQFIPEALNRFGFTEGQNQFDEWRRSHWNSDDPETALTCRDCHMRLVAESSDPGRGEAADAGRDRDDGAHRHHGFIATNAFMAEALALPGWQRHVELTEEWMRGDTVLPELEGRWPAGPVAGLQLEAPERAVVGGQAVAIRAIVVNRKAGHNFVTGPLDFVRSWIYLVVRDAGGTILAEHGGIDPQSQDILDQAGRLHALGNARDDGTLVLEAMPMDEHGTTLRRHELWRAAGGHGKRVIFAGASDAQTYRLIVPPGTLGPLTVAAELRYRRYRQEFLELMVPELARASGRVQRTTVQATATVQIELVFPPLPKG